MIYENAIVGYGVLGKATEKGLLRKKTPFHDPKYNTTMDPLYNCKNAFICLPTNDHFDQQNLIKVCRNIVNHNPNVNLFIRSTVQVGTCSYIKNNVTKKVWYIPEFLRDQHWEQDCQTEMYVVGGDSLPDFMEGSMLCSLEEAELIKMYSNNMAALKITFSNMMYDLSVEHEADYNKVKEGYIRCHHDSYLDVPGHDGQRGFGGKCLPKDLNFLIDSFQKKGITSALLNTVRWMNEDYRKMGKFYEV